MKVVIVADHHYYRDENGDVYVPSVYGYTFWKRYLNVFDEIIVLARGNRGKHFDKKNMILASGQGVSFRFIYDYSGTVDLIKHYFSVKRQIKEHLRDADAAIVRVPTPISLIAVNMLISSKKHFSVEVAADPIESYDDVRFSRIVKRMMYNHCKKACIEANGVAYVTKHSLQKRYPSYASLHGQTKTHFDTYYADVELLSNVFEKQKKYSNPVSGRIIHVANAISGDGKGHYVALDVIAGLKSKGINTELVFVGDGPEVPALKARIKELGIEEQVVFTGRISNPAKLNEQYYISDIFFLPSKTEGLPRSLIEAMACGLVCVASDVGGIPELLDDCFIFKWNHTEEYVEIIAELLSNPDKMAQIGNANREKVREYSVDNLRSKRSEFYGKLKSL